MKSLGEEDGSWIAMVATFSSSSLELAPSLLSSPELGEKGWLEPPEP